MRPGLTTCCVLFVSAVLCAAETALESPWKQVPSCTVRDLNGRTVSTKQFTADGPTVVVFWSSCCPTNVNAIRAFMKIHATFADRSLPVLAINENGGQETAKVRQFVKTEKLPFTVVIDKDRELMASFNAAAPPTFLFVKKGGVIADTHAGYFAGDEKKFEQHIARLLDETTGETQPREKDAQ